MRDIITIDDSGVVAVPSGNIMMKDYEIADMLGIIVPTVKGKIKPCLNLDSLEIVAEVESSA